jgi:hypothetical protein
MPRACDCCQHPKRAEIDAQLMAGEAFASIAKAVGGVHRLAVARHKSHVLRNVAAQAVAADMGLEADDDPPDAPAEQGTFNERLQELVGHASELMKIARKTGDVRAALQAIRDIRAITEAQVRLAELAATNPAAALDGGPGCVVILPDNNRNEVPDAETDADVDDTGDRDVDE